IKQSGPFNTNRSDREWQSLGSALQVQALSQRIICISIIKLTIVSQKPCFAYCNLNKEKNVQLVTPKGEASRGDWVMQDANQVPITSAWPRSAATRVSNAIA